MPALHGLLHERQVCIWRSGAGGGRESERPWSITEDLERFLSWRQASAKVTGCISSNHCNHNQLCCKCCMSWFFSNVLLSLSFDVLSPISIVCKGELQWGQKSLSARIRDAMRGAHSPLVLVPTSRQNINLIIIDWKPTSLAGSIHVPRQSDCFATRRD